MRNLFAILLLATGLTACVNMTTQATETEKELCRVWGESLPTRSRADTEQTRAEITQAYADFASACPAFKGMIP
jgi:hypothetical protein